MAQTQRFHQFHFACCRSCHFCVAQFCALWRLAAEACPISNKALGFLAHRRHCACLLVAELSIEAYLVTIWLAFRRNLGQESASKFVQVEWRLQSIPILLILPRLMNYLQGCLLISSFCPGYGSPLQSRSNNSPTTIVIVALNSNILGRMLQDPLGDWLGSLGILFRQPSRLFLLSRSVLWSPCAFKTLRNTGVSCVHDDRFLCPRQGNFGCILLHLLLVAPVHNIT